MSDNLVALLRECRKIISQSYFGGNPHSDLLSRIDAALTAQPDAVMVPVDEWNSFISDYNRYCDGDPKLDFQTLRISLAVMLAAAKEPK